MYIVTSELMRRIDEETIKRFVPGLTLMERAGMRVFERIEDEFGSTEGLTVSVFLGSGNNAGDGLVVARLLVESGARVYLNYMRPPENLSPDAYKNYTKLQALEERERIVENFLFSGDWRKKATEAINESDLIVDALLGTGISKPVKEDYAEVIELINESGVLICSIDIPSGVNGDTGEIMGHAVIADFTVTLGLAKVGCVFFPGKACVGELSIGDIGIPDEVIEECRPGIAGVDYDTAYNILPERLPWVHKFQCGSLLVVAGSVKYAGAAHLASLSALKSGCGIVYLAGPSAIRTVIQSSAPEIIFLELPQTPAGSLAEFDVSELLGSVRFDALAIGCGLTTEAETVKMVKEIVSKVEVPVLIDADGVNAFTGEFDRLKELSKDRDIVISPHSGELKRLTGVSVPELAPDRIRTLLSLVKGTGLTLVHKGAPTVVAHPEGTVDVNMHGHYGQATAGSGDVLTGAVGSFLAQGCKPGDAARLGVYLHSRAAEIAFEKTGARGMIAGDCMEALPEALKELE